MLNFQGIILDQQGRERQFKLTNIAPARALDLFNELVEGGDSLQALHVWNQYGMTTVPRAFITGHPISPQMQQLKERWQDLLSQPDKAPFINRLWAMTILELLCANEEQLIVYLELFSDRYESAGQHTLPQSSHHQYQQRNARLLTSAYARRQQILEQLKQLRVD